MPRTPVHEPHRRGVAIVAVLLILLVSAFVVTALVIGGTRHQDLSLHRWESVQAFYAAEAGMNMSLREALVAADEDGDGGVGTISDDGIDVNDPAFGAAQVSVTSQTVGAQTVLTSRGRAGSSERRLEATIQ